MEFFDMLIWGLATDVLEDEEDDEEDSEEGFVWDSEDGEV